MKKFYNTLPEEQETIINIDYGTKEVNCYTSRKTQITKLTKKLGEPTQIYHIDKKISGASWTIPFSDKKSANIIFSKSIIIGQL